jgi:hypothetical protein
MARVLCNVDDERLVRELHRPRWADEDRAVAFAGWGNITTEELADYENSIRRWGRVICRTQSH